MAVTAKLVKELRDKTGAGMMDCKKALMETDGDIDKAIDVLREKGLSKAAWSELHSTRITARQLSLRLTPRLILLPRILNSSSSLRLWQRKRWKLLLILWRISWRCPTKEKALSRMR